MTKKTISFQALTENMSMEEINEFIECIESLLNTREECNSKLKRKNHIQIYVLKYDYLCYQMELDVDSCNTYVVDDLVSIIGEKRYREIEDKYYGKYVYISLDKAKRVKRDMEILHELETTNRSSTEIGKEYGMTGDAIRMLKKRYKNHP